MAEQCANYSIKGHNMTLVGLISRFEKKSGNDYFFLKFVR